MILNTIVRRGEYMDAALYVKILSDKSIIDLKKIKYKFPDVDIKELIALLKSSVYKTMPIPDFSGNNLVYMENAAQVRMKVVKLLLTPQSSNEAFGLKAMEDEIASSLTIESIDFSRDSVRKILRGYAPADESENRIFGMRVCWTFSFFQKGGIFFGNRILG